MIKKTPTIRDVAALAGVSHQTVSRVINDADHVLPETRKKVEEAMTALSYRPNAIARSMSHGQTKIIACVTPSLKDHSSASIFQAAVEEARLQGYFVMGTIANSRDAFVDCIEKLVKQKRVDAVLVFTLFLDSRYSKLTKDVNAVYVGVKHSSVNSISSDNYLGIQKAVRHLYGLGHRRIFHISGPKKDSSAAARLAGFKDIVTELGCDSPEAGIIEGDWSAISGYHAFKSILEFKELPTAICVQNDHMAVGAIRAALEAGLKIPEDISITGFDDIPLASYFDPPLTTIQQDFKTIGIKAVDILIKSIQNENRGNEHIMVDTMLIHRNSTCILDKQN